MPPIHLSLKGEIGIRKGLGLEEVQIDFSKLQPGIIAITGETGRGKSTIADHSHHFRKLVFRKRNLSDQFYLRDSHRIFRSIYNGDEYESRILIDGKTGASEAYLYCNNNPKPLNDGKVSTYDKVVEEIFGSFNVYSKSAYSKQVVANPFSKDKGMEPNDLRMLFSEIFDLTKYQIKFKFFSKELQRCEEQYRLAEEQIKLWQNQIDAITATDKDIDEAVISKAQHVKIVADLESSIKNIGREKQNKEIELASLKKQEAEAGEVRRKITLLVLDKAEVEKRKSETVKLLEMEKFEKLTDFESNDPHLKRVKELTSQKQIAAEKAEVEKSSLAAAKLELDGKITGTNTKITEQDSIIERNEKLNANITTIDDKLTEKNKLTVELNELIAKERLLIDEKSLLQDAEKKETEALKTLETKLAGLSKKYSEIVNSINQLDKDEKRTLEEKTARVKEIKDDTAIIDNTPCDASLPAICPPIMNLVAKKSSIPDLEKSYDVKIGGFRKDKSTKSIELFENEGETESVNLEKAEKESFIKANFTDKYVTLDLQNNELKPKIKDLSGKLAEVNKSDWEALKIEANNATNKINMAKATKESLRKLLDEYTKQLKEKESAISNIQLNLSDKIQDIETQILNENVLSSNAKTTLESDWAQKVKNEEDRAADKIKLLDGQIDELNLKVNSDLAESIQNLAGIVAGFDQQIIDSENLLKQAQTELNELERKIGELQQQIGLKSVNQDNIKNKEAELRFWEREIKEFSLLSRAYDKTGIPVLKIDNSGPEVSQKTNELLDVAGFPFKAKLITTEATQKGTMKEVFKIKIIEDNLTSVSDEDAEMSLKSGGEQSWISTALQLAIATMTKKQGKPLDTLWLDEKDGNFDGALAHKYFQMLYKVKELIKVDYIYVISHRSEITDMMSQRIELHDGFLRIVNEVA